MSIYNTIILFLILINLIFPCGLSTSWASSLLVPPSARDGLEGLVEEGMSDEEYVREGNIGFRNERTNYLDHLHGYLPEVLKDRQFSYPWPMDMSNPERHILSFFGDEHLNKPNDEQLHPGIDIQTEPGTNVRTIEDGVVVKVDTFEHMGVSNISNVIIFSRTTKLFWIYGHMDLESLPEKIRAHHYYWDIYSKEEVKSGEFIGKVAKWHTHPGLSESVQIPEDVEKVYGRSYNHLHLQVAVFKPEKEEIEDYELMEVDRFTLQRLPNVNPLLLLQPLYKVPSDGGIARPIIIVGEDVEAVLKKSL